MDIQSTLKKGVKILHEYNIKNPHLDSEILLSKTLNKDRKYIILNLKKNLNKDTSVMFLNLIERRKKGEPIAYLLNKREFWKYSFYVDCNVLIPRPDTEHLVEEILKLSSKDTRQSVLDVGTGSGCILLSILRERRNFLGIGIDISKKAINVARFNAKIHQLINRVKFYNSDVDKFLLGKYDIIISNPPYIKKNDLKYLERDVVNYEPNLALNGGSDGFFKIIKVINKASVLIKKKGKFVLEIGSNQKNGTVSVLKKNGFYINKIIKDYGKNDRCIISTKL
jgi:release factor glutamine methyltransferase